MNPSLLQYVRDLEYLGYSRTERKTILQTSGKRNLDARLEREFCERSKMTFSATGAGAMALIIPSIAAIGAANAESPIARCAYAAVGIITGAPCLYLLVKGFLASQREHDRAHAYGSMA